MKKINSDDKEQINKVILDLLEKFITEKEYDALEYCYALNKISLQLIYEFSNEDKIATGIVTRLLNEVICDRIDEDFRDAELDRYIRRIQ